MRISIGIVRETKSIWEKRTPLIPADIKKLIAKYPIDIFVQPSEKRIYSNDEYIEAGAIVQEDLSNCSILVGIKEVKTKNLLPDKTYTFFSHTIKGQDYNMKMLQKIIDSGITLVDYEKIEDKNGKRLIFFSVQAGLAGIIDSLWSLGQRYECEGINTPFSSLRQAYHYDSLEEAKNALLEAGDKIKSGEFPQELAPLTIGISGYGNVSSGVQQLLDLLPVKEISPAELISLKESGKYSKLLVYKIVFKEKDMVHPISVADIFNLQDYYDNPTKYKSIFENYLPYLTVFINATYWDSKYPRFVTNQYLKTLYSQEKVKLKIIGDITCDIEGGIECTLKPADPGNPVYVYNPIIGEIRDGFKGNGPVIMAIEILPSEIPRESSNHFSSVFSKLLPGMLISDLPDDFEKLEFPYELKNAVITYKGKLTPNYQYLEEFLK